MIVRIMNHHTRKCDAVVEQVRAMGVEPEVLVDETDWNKSKDQKLKYRGTLANYLRCVAAVKGEQWVVVVHDDVELAPNALEKMGHVLKYAPRGNVISFYNPSNSTYDACGAAGRHVIRLRKYWPQCHAFPCALAPGFTEWVGRVQGTLEGTEGEDRMLQDYCRLVDAWIFAVVPSLSQHIGYDRSIQRIAPSVGGRLRRSDNYAPLFDPTAVDWAAEFSNPFKG